MKPKGSAARVVIVVAAFLFGCHPYVRVEKFQTFSSLPPDCCPRLAGPEEAMPPGSVAIAKVYCSNVIAVRANCSYRQNMERLRVEACRLGADVAQIDEHEMTDLESACYSYTATLYRLEAGLDSETASDPVPDRERSVCASGFTGEFRTDAK